MSDIGQAIYFLLIPGLMLLVWVIVSFVVSEKGGKINWIKFLNKN